MRNALGILTVLLLVAPAWGSLTLSKMDMENRLSERVQDIATKADPTAFARVEIKLKKIRSKLSFLGMETQVTPLENGQDIGPESIETIEVRVLSKLDPFPEWLQKEIAAAVVIEGIDAKVTYMKPESPLRDVTAQLAEFFSEDLYSSLRKSVWGVWALALLVLAGFGGMGYVIMNLATKVEAILQKVIAENLVPMATALGQIAGTSGKSVPAAAAKEKTNSDAPPRMVVSGDSKNQFDQFPAAAISALFVDCYWTKKDGYAHYLWTQLAPSQREALMKSAAVDADYFSHIIGVPPQPEDYHSHAWYMNPHAKFSKVDQKGLGDWLKANLEASHMISPLRFDYVELTLEERLKIAGSTKRVDVDVKTLPAGQPRVFAPKLRFSSLSEADEMYLFKNFAKVHADARAQLKTLVWLAIAPIEQRKKILDQLDARQLAEAWVAPKPILEELRKALSPKKLEMLDHFMKTGAPSRNGDVFSYLAEAGLEAAAAAVAAPAAPGAAPKAA